MTERQTIGYVDDAGCLRCLNVEDCDQYALLDGSRLFDHEGRWYRLTLLDSLQGGLAERLSWDIAAELLLGSGCRLPPALLRLVQQNEKPKSDRSKPRRMPRIPARRGLGEFVEARRTRQSHDSSS